MIAVYIFFPSHFNINTIHNIGQKNTGWKMSNKLEFVQTDLFDNDNM